MNEKSVFRPPPVKEIRHESRSGSTFRSYGAREDRYIRILSSTWFLHGNAPGLVQPSVRCRCGADVETHGEIRIGFNPQSHSRVIRRAFKVDDYSGIE